MNPILAKMAQIFSVAVFAFILGGWTFLLSGACTEFRGEGGRWALVAAIVCAIGLAVGLLGLVRNVWASRAT